MFIMCYSIYIKLIIINTNELLIHASLSLFKYFKSIDSTKHVVRSYLLIMIDKLNVIDEKFKARDAKCIRIQISLKKQLSSVSIVIKL